MAFDPVCSSGHVWTVDLFIRCLPIKQQQISGSTGSVVALKKLPMPPKKKFKGEDGEAVVRTLEAAMDD